MPRVYPCGIDPCIVQRKEYQRFYMSYFTDKLYVFVEMVAAKAVNLGKWIVLLIVGVILLRFLLNRIIRFIKKKRYLHSTIHRIDIMQGVEFEECLKAHFERMGYKVNLTPKSGDYGVDLICHGRKDHFVVQAKRYSGKIGISAVQQIIGGMHYYGFSKGMVVTNSYFTKNAHELAEKSNVVLWDRDTLQKKFRIAEGKGRKIN